MKSFLQLLVSSLIILTPLATFAEKMSVEDMKSTCSSGFLKDADKTSDPEIYKSYVNKLCDCSGNKLGGRELTDQSEVMAGIGSCMRVTLLTESMNQLKDDDAISEEKISAMCMKEWKIFTSAKPGQGTLEKSCACSAKQIMSLPKDQRTDESKLDQIAMSCAAKDS